MGQCYWGWRPPTLLSFFARFYSQLSLGQSLWQKMRLVRTKICQCLKSRDLGCTGTSTSTGTSTGPGTRVDFKCKNRRWSEVFLVFLFRIIFSTIFSTTTAVWMYFIIIILYQGRRVFCTSFSVTIRAINETTEDANVGDVVIWQPQAHSPPWGGGCVWTDYLISWYVLILCDDDSTVVMYKCAETTTERVLYAQGKPFFFLSTARNHL